MSSVGIIEPDGILKACTTKVLMNNAKIRAMIIASKYSRIMDFFLLCDNSRPPGGKDLAAVIIGKTFKKRKWYKKCLYFYARLPQEEKPESNVEERCIKGFRAALSKKIRNYDIFTEVI